MQAEKTDDFGQNAGAGRPLGLPGFGVLERLKSGGAIRGVKLSSFDVYRARVCLEFSPPVVGKPDRIPTGRIPR